MAVSRDDIFVHFEHFEDAGDAAADASTRYLNPGTLAAASLFSGTLEEPDDEDWVRFSLSREDVYRLVAVTVDGSPLSDLELRVVDANGIELATSSFLPNSTEDDRFYVTPRLAGNEDMDPVFVTIKSASGQQTGEYAVYVNPIGDYRIGNVLKESPGDDLLLAIEGAVGLNAQLSGADGDDTLVGFGGNDTLKGQNGNDVLWGGDGNDFLRNGYLAFAGPGNDRIFAAGHSEPGVLGRYYGGDGDDHIRTFNSPGTAWGGRGNDTVIGGIIGDDLRGGDGDDLLYGDRENDTLTGGLGADDLRGGEGFDTATYAYAAQGITLSLWNQWDNAGAARGDWLRNIERIVATDHDDLINGNAFRNVLLGGAGDDTLRGGGGDARLEGGAGDDVLSGGAGDDVLLGGAGADVFVFRAGQGADTILDFDASQDVLRLDAASVSVTDDGTHTFIRFGSDQIALLDTVLTQSEITVEFV